tara:strand:+ start:1697 stop:2524 length:828 start_codon:yes stop_codon:yes gene_type:complete
MGFITKIQSLEEVPQFIIDKVPVYDGEHNRIPETYSLKRSDTQAHVGIVGEKYRPIQMVEMIDIVDRASKQIGDIEHIGFTESNKGKKMLIQSKLSEDIDVGGDKVQPYFYTLIDNSGMASNKLIPSTERIICDNAFHLVQTSRENNTRHASTFDGRVTSMIDGIVESIEKAKNFGSTMEKLKSSKFTTDQMVKLTQCLVPVQEDESTKRMHKRERLVELFSSGKGNEGETRWDAFNALTEYETHNGRQSPEKLVRSMINSTMSKRGLELLELAA